MKIGIIKTITNISDIRNNPPIFWTQIPVKTSTMPSFGHLDRFRSVVWSDAVRSFGPMPFGRLVMSEKSVNFALTVSATPLSDAYQGGTFTFYTDMTQYQKYLS